MQCKVVILGDSGVGKTSLITRYIEGGFQKTIPTISASFWTKKMVVDRTKVTLQIWDTAGQERFRSLTSLYYRGANAAILVYDQTDVNGFESVKNWVNELKENTQGEVLIFIAANKVDLPSKVDNLYVQEYAKSINAQLFYTSAKENKGIEDLFKSIVAELMKNKKDIPQEKEEPEVNNSSSCC